jgi:hypothetical protein
MSDDPITNGTWDSCKMYVLRELQRMNNMHEKMDEKLDGINETLISLKVKMGFIGGIAGFVFGGLISIIIKAAK